MVMTSQTGCGKVEKGNEEAELQCSEERSPGLIEDRGARTSYQRRGGDGGLDGLR
jgi:hypothetical protein